MPVRLEEVWGGKLTWLRAAGDTVGGALDLLLTLLEDRLLTVGLEAGGGLVGGGLAAT